MCAQPIATNLQNKRKISTRQGFNPTRYAIYQFLIELMLSMKQFAHSQLFPNIQIHFAEILSQKYKVNLIN